MNTMKMVAVVSTLIVLAIPVRADDCDRRVDLIKMNQ